MMTARKGRYVNITQSQMEEFLRVGKPGGFMQMSIPGTIELVYGKVFRRGDCDENQQVYTMRIYTGINPTGESRGVGKDAIRVEMYAKNDRDQSVRVGGSKRVNRVDGWSARIKERMDNWEGMLGPQCPKCNGPMVVRKVKSGLRKGSKFYGCCSYPSCSGTSSINVDKDLEE